MSENSVSKQVSSSQDDFVNPRGETHDLQIAHGYAEIEIEKGISEYYKQLAEDLRQIQAHRQWMFYLLFGVMSVFYACLLWFLCMDLLPSKLAACITPADRVLGGARDYFHAAELVVLAAIPTLIAMALSRSLFRREKLSTEKVEEGLLSNMPLKQLSDASWGGPAS